MATIKPTRIDASTGKPARDTRWRLRYRDANNRSRSETFSRKEDAKARQADIDSELRRQEWIDPRKAARPFKELASSWWETTVKLAPHTRRGYFVLLHNHVLPYFGDQKQSSIDFLTVEEFIAEKLNAGHKPKRVRDMVSVVSLIMKLAIASGLRRDNPAAAHSITVRRRRISHGDTLSMDDAMRLTENTRDPYKPLVWLLMITGARPAEVCGLRVEHLDFGRRLLHLAETVNYVHGYGDQPAQLHRGPTKTEAGDRFIPLPQWLCDDLAAMLAARSAERGTPIGPGEPMFESVKGGKVLTVPSLRRWIIRPALEAAGLPVEMRTYDTRHSHATLLIDDGANLLEIAERMGHTDPAVTMREYGHLVKGAQQRLTDRMETMRQTASEARAASSATGEVIDLAGRRARRKAASS